MFCTCLQTLVMELPRTCILNYPYYQTFGTFQKLQKRPKTAKNKRKPQKTTKNPSRNYRKIIRGTRGAPRLGRSQARLLARSALVCADLKIFGGPRGASSALVRSNWVFGGPRGIAHAPVRKPRRRFERAFLFKQGFQRSFRHFRRVF